MRKILGTLGTLCTLDTIETRVTLRTLTTPQRRDALQILGKLKARWTRDKIMTFWI